MKLCCLIFLTSWLSILGSAAHAQRVEQTSTEKGIVVTGETNTPVDGATLVFMPGAYRVTTDERGEFIFRSAKLTFDSISITAVGYEKTVVSYADFIGQQRSIKLKEDVIELSSVTVALQPGEQYNYISKVDIRTRDITNSQEVLRLVPGLFIGQHAGGGKAEQIFLRGFDIDHGTDINIAVDGMPVNMVSHAHGQGYADLHFLIPELIENVRFKKGPYYAEKGNMATAGYVDFQTKNILSSNMVKVEAGQFDTYRAVGMMNLSSRKMRSKNQHAFIASEYMYTNGYFDSPQDFNRFNVFGKYKRALGARNELSVAVSAFSSKWDASGQIPERALERGLIGYFGAIDPNEGGNTTRKNINVQLQTMLRNGDVIRNQVYYTNYDFELFSNFTFFLNNSQDGDQIKQKEKRNLVGYNGSYKRTAYIGGKKLSTDFGAGMRYDATNNSELSRTKDRDILIDPLKRGDINEINTSAWLNETIQLTERLSATAGIRWDYFHFRYKDKLAGDQVGKAGLSALSPKVNFQYQLNTQTQLYLSAGKGFHSNDTRVVVPRAAKQVLPAAYGSDLGIVIKPARNLLFQAALWYLFLDQEFVYVGDEAIVEPSGRSRRMGIDLCARYQPIKALFLDADFNYSHGRAIDEPKGQDFLPLSPAITSIGGITYRHSKGFNGSLRYRYMGDRPANEDQSLVAKGYFVMDAVLSYEHKKYEIGLSAQNLFDVRWKETQFETESKLRNETDPVSEIHFTPGTPFFLKAHLSFFF